MPRGFPKHITKGSTIEDTALAARRPRGIPAGYGQAPDRVGSAGLQPRGCLPARRPGRRPGHRGDPFLDGNDHQLEMTPDDLLQCLDPWPVPPAGAGLRAFLAGAAWSVVVVLAVLWMLGVLS